MRRLGPTARLVAATLDFLSREGWRDMTLAAVVRAAKLSWTDALACAASKSALPGLVLRWTADETARRYRPIRASRSARERVFEVTMTWFDVQQHQKSALCTLYKGLRDDPLALLSARGEIMGVAQRILALAEADAGVFEAARGTCFAVVIARATAAWFEDDRDLGKTMAQLDRDLGRIGPLLWPNNSVPEKNSRKRRRR